MLLCNTSNIARIPGIIFFVISCVIAKVAISNPILAINAITLKSPNIFSDIISNEYQVYRMLHPDSKYGKNHFNYQDSYICARYTRESGSWPNEKYYTTERPRYVGRYVRREEFGYGDQGGRTDYFDINGKSIPIEMDYEGRVCFKPVHPAVVPYYNYLAGQEA